MKLVKPIETITIGPKRALTGGVVADPEFIWSGGAPNKLVRLLRKDYSISGTFAPLALVRQASGTAVFGGIGECRAIRRSDGTLVWEAEGIWYRWNDTIVIPGETSVELRKMDSGEVIASLPLKRRKAGLGAFGARDGVVVLRAESKEMFAVDLASGQELWCRDVFGELHSKWSLPEQSLLKLNSTEGRDGLVSFYSTSSIAWSPTRRVHKVGERRTWRGHHAANGCWRSRVRGVR